jgi:hypothetical protein
MTAVFIFTAVKTYNLTIKGIHWIFISKDFGPIFNVGIEIH